MSPEIKKKYIEPLVLILCFGLFFGFLGYKMGVPNMFNTLMQTSYHLLMETVFYLMGIVVLTGAFSRILVEFGVIGILEKLLRPLMKPLYNLPGVAALGAVMTFVSDNPAIISLSKDKRFSSYFRKYQLISLTNFGTAFGMGLVVVVFMIAQGYGFGAVIGLIGSVIGSIISTRLMQRFIAKSHPELVTEMAGQGPDDVGPEHQEHKEEKTVFLRFLNSLLDGGKTGVELGMQIIPGVLIISTVVMMLTFGPSDNGYTGAAYEGVKALPWLADKVSFIFEWLFGFNSSELVAFPITALGAVGAALGLVPRLNAEGLIDGNAIAVFTAMGMCWSGFLSTHTAMLDSLGYRELTSKAIIAHTFGGLGAGIAAHWIYVGVTLLFPATPSVQTMCMNQPMSNVAVVTSVGDNKYEINKWYDNEKDVKLDFTVDPQTKAITITNADDKREGYDFVYIDKKAEGKNPCYAMFYTGKNTSAKGTEYYSNFTGDEEAGQMYVWMVVRDASNNELYSGYYRIGWGGKKAPKKSDEDEHWNKK